MARTDDELRARRDELEKRGQSNRAELAQFNVDPARARTIDLNFWAPDKEASDRLAHALIENGLPTPIVLSPAADGSGDRRWLLRTAMTASVDFMTTRENVVTFLLVADKYDCDFDGWGTAVVEAANRQQKGN